MRRLPTTLLILLLLAACGRPGPSTPAAATAASSAKGVTLLLTAADLLTVQPSALATGPVITGSVQPERRADLRAEVASVITEVTKDNGQPVRAGELLMRLDDTALRESLASAEQAARAAGQALEQAERALDRLKTLQKQGMATTQALEDAEIRRNSAKSELVAAQSRVAAARQQLQRTQVRAPFAGIVSERKASVGDTAQVGKELVKVIDPASMRFEGLVTADRLDQLKVGQSVSFHINGFGNGEFEGTVERIDAAVDSATRQVAVLVGFDDRSQAPRVAGLFAEGRIAGSGTPLPTVPESVLVRIGESVSAWRVDGNALAKVALKLGDRDPRSGLYPVLGGLKAGDRVLAHPGAALVDGQPVEFAARPAAVPASAAAAR